MSSLSSIVYCNTALEFVLVFWSIVVGDNGSRTMELQHQYHVLTSHVKPRNTGILNGSEAGMPRIDLC